MPRCCGLAVALLLFTSSLFAADPALWNEYGLAHTQTAAQGKLTVTTYEMKDLTGALAAWEALRSPAGHACSLSEFCTEDGTQTVISDYNFVLVFDGAKPTKAQVEAAIQALPNKHATSLPAILTFVPRQGLVPDSARYILGPVSLKEFAPELASSKPGFADGAEAQVAEYRVGKNPSPVRLALFYYASPEMARVHVAEFKSLAGTHVKRSGVLVAIVFGSATGAEADTLLSRVQYEAKITWNETPPPNPIRPLFRLLWNIIYLSLVLGAISLAAGLMYAGMRIYRRRFGTLEAEESMTTLRLSGK